MARYTRHRKSETRDKIVRLASERFRERGVDGVGVAGLMAAIGLTNGGFYAHFHSKEALVREAAALALRELDPERAAILADGKFDLALFIDTYLSPEHRRCVAGGCAMAAMSPDLARRPAGVRTGFLHASQHTIERIALGLPSEVAGPLRAKVARQVFAQLVGTMQMARLAPDDELANSILAAGRQAARVVAGLASWETSAP